MRHRVKTTFEIQKENEKRVKELQLEHPQFVGTPIVFFDGQYGFLSNFFNSPIELQGYTFKNGESAFQGFKNMGEIKNFATLNSSDAKKKGRQVKLRADWEEIKDDIMYQVVYAKFSQNAQLKNQLLQTGKRLLVEGNWWNDTTWGVCNNKGENRLGTILMRVREELSA